MHKIATVFFILKKKAQELFIAVNSNFKWYMFAFQY